MAILCLIGPLCGNDIPCLYDWMVGLTLNDIKWNSDSFQCFKKRMLQYYELSCICHRQEMAIKGPGG